MGDLQCAATFLVLPPAPRVSMEQLRIARVACLYAEPGVDAKALADALGVTERDLELGAAGVPSGFASDQPRPADKEPGPADDQPRPADLTSPAALTAAFTDLADEFRGETVAVVVSEATYARLTGEVLATSAPAAVVEIDADSRRWRPYE